MAAEQKQMPRYQCHKKVWALKIKSIGGSTDDPAFLLLTPEEEGFEPIKVPREFGIRHNIQAGGYYVLYEDGYKSYSPAKAFEDGYTRFA